MTNTLAPSERDDGFPSPRPFQTDSHNALRKGFRDGHKNQLIMAPTGAGKTYLGLRICREAMQKGKRAVFLCDRTTLINQTSEAADSYGLNDHGVIQANHQRRRPNELLQIASAQTISKRGYWPQLDVLVVDECHTQMKVWTEYAMSSGAAVIGLSATPFSVGLGKIFTNLINATTMHDLTQSGVLVPMRIFSCTKPDMRGAATAGGEWTDKAAEERGMDIIGDVVKEWMKFADNRKTIVFGATIKHCEEIAKQFINQGVMAAVFTSETTPKERQNLLDEYRKPKGYLKVLISVEALAKGFDVPDVGCICDARPLRKSLSTAIQMWGRGLRSSPDTGKKDCIASGMRVLTDRGLVAIEQILLDDKIWDGHDFVSHSGVIYRGKRKVITYAGITATPDHRVKTSAGWSTLGECADQQTAIITTGIGGKAIRECDGYFTGRTLAWPKAQTIHARFVRMHEMWLSFNDRLSKSCKRTIQGLSAMWKSASSPRLVVCKNGESKKTLQQSQRLSLEGLRWTWNRISIFFANRGRFMGNQGVRNSRELFRVAVGQNQQRRSLRAGEHSLGYRTFESQQYPKKQVDSINSSIQDESSRNSLFGRNPAISFFKRIFYGSNHRKVSQAITQAEREVWDILNCGPRNSFTCEGLLVHNCLLLDFSGNIIRFAEDFTEVFFNGLDSLDSGDKLDKNIRKDEDIETYGCPKCGYKPFHKRCMACGHEKIAPPRAEALPGHMQEITIGEGKNKKKLADNAEHLWQQVVTYARIHSKADTQQGRAWHLYKKITGQEPMWKFSTAPNVEISRNVIGKITNLNMAFRNGTAK